MTKHGPLRLCYIFSLYLQNASMSPSLETCGAQVARPPSSGPQSYFLHHPLVASHHTLGCCQPPTLDSVLFSSVPPRLAKEDSQQLNEVRKESKYCMKQALTYPACLQTVLTPSQFGNSPQKLWMLG